MLTYRIAQFMIAYTEALQRAVLCQHLSNDSSGVGRYMTSTGIQFLQICVAAQGMADVNNFL